MTSRDELEDVSRNQKDVHVKLLKKMKKLNWIEIDDDAELLKKIKMKKLNLIDGNEMNVVFHKLVRILSFL